MTENEAEDENKAEDEKIDEEKVESEEINSENHTEENHKFFDPFELDFDEEDTEQNNDGKSE
jgi:hypothetical protein